MRLKFDPQRELNLSRATTKTTRKYYDKYDAISEVLDANPDILSVLHEDLKKPLKYVEASLAGRPCTFTTENVLRTLIVLIVEGMSLRRVVCLVDDSEFLRRFTRIYGGGMMDFSTLDKLKNSIRPETWELVNGFLASYAVEERRITGDRLRLDTTAVESNIHYPTDSSLLWDGYRTLARLISAARKLDPGAVGDRRLREKKAKSTARDIGRLTGRTKSRRRMKSLYKRLLKVVGAILSWSAEVQGELAKRIEKGRYGLLEGMAAQGIASEISHYTTLVRTVWSQAKRRVIDEEQVPNNEKIFSIFEEHTELLKRGKVGKPIEFGHMIEIQQVSQKFITGYRVFGTRPNETLLLEPSVERHKALFGHYPTAITADKGYYEGGKVESIRRKIDTVAIAKIGKRTPEQTEHEHSKEFRVAQRFRAGVEGSISFLKRVLGLCRCLNKGWQNFQSTVGMTIFTHNLLKLAVP
jgi:IS5 family transposase